MIGICRSVKGKRHRLADQVLVAIVGRVDGHGGIAEHRLGAGGGDQERLVGVDHRVADRPELAERVDVLDLVVGHGGPELDVPVDQPLPSVNLVGLEEVEEGGPDGLGAHLVEGEPGPGPVARTAHQAELPEDPGLVLVLPGPDSPDQLVAADVVAGLVFFLAQAGLDDGLGGDPGVVGAGHPEGVVALHPPPPDQDILDRVIQGMAQVQRPGDVRRRDDDGVGVLLARRVGMKIPFFEPEIIPTTLGVLGVVLLGEFGGAHARSERKGAVEVRPNEGASKAGPRRGARFAIIEEYDK